MKTLANPLHFAKRVTMYHSARMHLGAGSIARVAGIDLHWTEIGSGPPLVLLHGLSDSHRTWALVAPALARTHRVLMPDLAGHGLSARPDASYALEWHAAIIGQWLDALDLDQIDLVGHSFGGGVAQWILLERRARVRRLGLIASGGLGRGVSLALRLAATPGIVEHMGQPFMGIGTHLGLRAAGSAFAPAEIADLAWMNARPGSARAMARTVRDVIAWDGQRRHFLDRAGEIGELPPTALYWGDRDRIIPISHANCARTYLDHVSVTRFSGCGHFPHRERPAQFLHALEGFLGAARVHPATRRASFVRRPRPSLWRRAWRAVSAIFRKKGPALREPQDTRRAGKAGTSRVSPETHEAPAPR